ncbi:hypothetical protein FA95DRAFT_1675506 [Auriscalpium vulgare]|uniref:Uncharacterized protein n=1 Tax=Auriscalpium vulgare TaxID=40419 RepID=A0ACB8S5Y4_9AGAM|nr:hypothetical protein FA95DRAFT_1675506 [Auriscalpium vulgare]
MTCSPVGTDSMNAGNKRLLRGGGHAGRQELPNAALRRAYLADRSSKDHPLSAASLRAFYALVLIQVLTRMAADSANPVRHPHCSAEVPYRPGLTIKATASLTVFVHYRREGRLGRDDRHRELGPQVTHRAVGRPHAQPAATCDPERACKDMRSRVGRRRKGGFHD